MLTVGAVMTGVAVAVDEGAAVPEIVDVVERCRVRTVAVVDGAGRLLGVIDSDDYPDLFQCVVDAPRVAGSRRQRDRRMRTGRCTARDLMSPFPVLADTCPLDEAARSLDDLDADFAIVVDRTGRVIGSTTRRSCRAELRAVVRPAPVSGPSAVPALLR